MLNFLFLFCLISAVICDVSRDELKKLALGGGWVPAVYFANITSYKIDPDNPLLKELGNNLIQWSDRIEEGENGIDIMHVNTKTGFEFVYEDLCRKFEESAYAQVVRQYLGIQVCPIKKGSLSYFSNVFTRPNQQIKHFCEDPYDITVKLFWKKEKKEVMRIRMFIDLIRLDECKYHTKELGVDINKLI